MNNKKTLYLLIFFVLITAAYIAYGNMYNKAETIVIETKLPNISEKPYLIAHAGGGIYGYKFTNSKEALTHAYSNGFRYIELDFEQTSDNEIVLIHDWDTMTRRLFEIEPKQLTLREFKSLPTFQNLTLMDINDLTKWLKEHNDVYIISDIKSDSVDILKRISKDYPGVAARLIPQIYDYSEYDDVKNLGYDKIILTLYRMIPEYNEVLEFALNNDLYAITMRETNAMEGLAKMLGDYEIAVYVHSINDLYIAEELNKIGVYGFYTDYFVPNQWAILK